MINQMYSNLNKCTVAECSYYEASLVHEKYNCSKTAIKLIYNLKTPLCYYHTDFIFGVCMYVSLDIVK